jgi:FKBP-type peptidyl-prolyl cis-trans isomerase FklB
MIVILVLFGSITVFSKKSKKVDDGTNEEGLDFLQKNARRPGVITTASGMQYRVLRPGRSNDAKPTLKNRVRIHIRGRRIDGEEFFESYSGRQPQMHFVKSVYPGMKEALLMMRPGEKWEVFLPSELAFGAKGFGSIRDKIKVPPNSAVIFQIELIDVFNFPGDEELWSQEKTEL